MLSKHTLDKIKKISPDESIGNEIVARLHVMEQGKDGLDTSEAMNLKIMQVLKSKMSNYHHGLSGEKIAKGLISIARSEDAVEQMDKIDLEALTLALNSIDAAKEFQNRYNNMADYKEPAESTLSEPIFSEPAAPKEEQVSISEAPAFVRKRIRLKRPLPVV